MSRTSVGRPVSLPSALAKLLLPLPGTPRRRTPRGLQRSGEMGPSSRFLLRSCCHYRKAATTIASSRWPKGPASQVSIARVRHLRLDRDKGSHVENDAVRAGVIPEWKNRPRNHAITLSAPASFRDGKTVHAIMPRNEQEFREECDERRCHGLGVNKKW